MVSLLKKRTFRQFANKLFIRFVINVPIIESFETLNQYNFILIFETDFFAEFLTFSWNKLDFRVERVEFFLTKFWMRINISLLVGWFEGFSFKGKVWLIKKLELQKTFDAFLVSILFRLILIKSYVEISVIVFIII